MAHHHESVEKRYDRAVSISPLAAFLIKAAAFLVLLAGSAYLIGSLLPWRPLEVYGFEVKPEKVCTNSAIQVRTDRLLRRGLPPDVRDVEIEIKSHWEDVKTGESTPEDTLPISEVKDGFGPYGRHKIISPLIREAPPKRGTWRLVGDYKVTGTPLYIHRTYTIEDVKSEPTLKTYSGEKCKGRA